MPKRKGITVISCLCVLLLLMTLAVSGCFFGEGGGKVGTRKGKTSDNLAMNDSMGGHIGAGAEPSQEKERKTTEKDGSEEDGEHNGIESEELSFPGLNAKPGTDENESPGENTTPTIPELPDDFEVPEIPDDFEVPRMPDMPNLNPGDAPLFPEAPSQNPGTSPQDPYVPINPQPPVDDSLVGQWSLDFTGQYLQTEQLPVELNSDGTITLEETEIHPYFTIKGGSYEWNPDSNEIHMSYNCFLTIAMYPPLVLEMNGTFDTGLTATEGNFTAIWPEVSPGRVLDQGNFRLYR